jgi:ubiquinone/menaquinone biosynthesis C-methylase UbiE
MLQELELIRDQQRESWNKFSPGWKKWDDLMMDFLKPMGDEIVNLTRPLTDDFVLDIASGTGEPGITIAKKCPRGKVVFTDLAKDMLDVAIGNAAIHGIKNFEARVCDVSELPFADDSFDVVSCRFGFMFFPDMLLAAKEMNRVLKPGGRLAVSVWGTPEKNFWVTAIGGTINKNMQLQAPASSAPGMFRCANPGLMQDILKQAGFRNTSEKEVQGKLRCKTTGEYWNCMTEVAAPFVAALSKADDAMKSKIKKEVFDLVNQKFPDGNVMIDASALVIYGQK